MTLVAVKLTDEQLALLDREVKRRRKKTYEINATRSSVIREAIFKLVAHA